MLSLYCQKGDKTMNKAEILAQIMFEEDEYREAHGMELMYYTKEDFEAEKQNRKEKTNENIRNTEKSR